MNKLGTCLWFNDKAEEAAKFYTSLFKNSKIGKTARYTSSAAEASGQPKDSVMTVDFEIEGLSIMALNGGPMFKFTPSFSFFVWCDSEKEITDLWQKLSGDGKVRMALDKYPWSDKYGWTEDKYGVEWQLNLKPYKQKIAPAFLFVDQLFGKGEEAINFYTSLFKNSKIDFMARDEKTNSIMHCVFSLDGQSFVLMEGQGKHGYTFSPAFSIVVSCENQTEIDQFWTKLSAGGETSQCGWLSDKYGVSWQIVPKVLAELSSGDPKRTERVMAEVMKMTKLDIRKLEAAAAAR